MVKSRATKLSNCVHGSDLTGMVRDLLVQPQIYK